MNRFMKWLDDLTYPFELRNIKNFSFKKNWLGVITFTGMALLLFFTFTGDIAKFPKNWFEAGVIFLWFFSAGVWMTFRRLRYSRKNIFLITVVVLCAFLLGYVCIDYNIPGNWIILISLILMTIIRGLLQLYQFLKRRRSMRN